MTNAGPLRAATLQACRFDVHSHTWEPIDPGGARPSARAGHSAIALGEFILVVGGGNGACGLAELHVLDTQRMLWIEAQQESLHGVAALAKEGLSLSLVGKTLFAFGGHDGKCHNAAVIADASKLLPALITGPMASPSAPPAPVSHQPQPSTSAADRTSLSSPSESALLSSSVELSEMSMLRRAIEEERELRQTMEHRFAEQLEKMTLEHNKLLSQNEALKAELQARGLKASSSSWLWRR